GFSQPWLRIFAPIHSGRLQTREIPEKRAPEWFVHFQDPFWHGLYLPIQKTALLLSKQSLRLQQGKITIYLLYAFITLIVLLAVIQ
ncbi:hydrogenase 4 subunit B, partial [Acidithiobacillus caldus]|nr:hydrogenase 4 subunit B [Acidithiobacillus caldus]